MCCAVAMVAESVPLCSLIIPKIVPVLQEELRDPLYSQMKEMTLTEAMCKVQLEQCRCMTPAVCIPFTQFNLYDRKVLVL